MQEKGRTEDNAYGRPSPNARPRMHTRTRAYTHARTRVRTHAHTHVHTHTAVVAITVRRTGYRYSVWPNRDGPLRLRQYRSLAIQITTRTGDPITPIFLMFSHIKTLLGRTETRTRDRMYFQTIRTVRDVSRDDRARIATCSLRMLTDRQILRRIIV